MTYARSRSQALIAALLLIFTCRLAEAKERWVDEALLHDGRIIEVNRSVSSHYGKGELSNALRKWPDQYELSAKNPDNGSVVRWSGERDFAPILLDFWNKVPHLVIVASSAFSELNRYACPEIPYIFFRFDQNSTQWVQMPAKDFPKALLTANLSFRYDPYFMAGGKRLSSADIDSMNASSELSSGKHTTRNIPTDFVSWPYRYKNEYRVGHYRDGCRHTVPSNEDPSHPQSTGQPSQVMALDILETRLYEPEWVIKGDAGNGARTWTDVSFDKVQYAKCTALLRRVGNESDKPELRGWVLFVKDPTRTKKARAMAQIFCDEKSLWFVEYAPDRSNTYLTKFSVQGDFLYRLKFAKPDRSGDYPGGILQSTFRAEAGYLFFDWWNTNQYGMDRRVARALKVRVREPDAAVQRLER